MGFCRVKLLTLVNLSRQFLYTVVILWLDVDSSV